ncbi:PhlD [Streptomyces sp. CC224B]|uniref:PhlD n=1 Tax=Streptomyces sp. CC224B TaxID=3044571 RepID=UPI0024A7F460|nr:PhlD [Streptomyces sp. CC224B]
MPYVTLPALAFPEYEISTLETVHDILKAMPEGHRLRPAVERLARSLRVDQRRFVAPLGEVSKAGTVAERNKEARVSMYRLGEKAARTAIERAGLNPRDIDCVITSHSTTPATPGLDVHVVNTVGLREDVLRMPATQLGCVAGAHTLAWAARLVEAMPGLRVLVLISEALSTVYRSDKNTTTGILYRLLFGDGSGACIVSSDPHGACLEIQDGWQYVVPGTMDYYSLEIEAEGMHFDSTSRAPDGINHLKEPLWEWLRKDDSTWAPEVAVVHSGGPRVLENAETVLGCAPELLSHSWESMRTRGNLGGLAVLDILDRTAASDPRHGSRTLLMSVGPGLTGAAVRGLWHRPTA